MRISNSEFTAFLNNPERYRLMYKAPLGDKKTGISPAQRSFWLDRGSAFHLLMEAHNKGWSKEQTDAKLKEGGFDVKATQNGHALYLSFTQRYRGDERFRLQDWEHGIVASEIEFEAKIPGSPHSLIGKMDELIEYEGTIWVGDYKTANAKATENKKRIEFEDSSQSDFYINAMRLLGRPVKGMLYRVVTEHNPPQHYVIPVIRSDSRLDVALLSIHQVCEMITMMMDTFTASKPWPHPGSSFPCNWYGINGSSNCEYSTLCRRPSEELTEADLEQFVPNKPHLSLME